MIDTVAYSLVSVGLAFDLFGCIGLVRLPDVYNRAQAATKCVTLGTCMLLAGVACLAFGRADIAMGIKAVLCAGFVLLTNPVAAHAICRGAYLSGIHLWSGSVEDAFAPRADRIRKERAGQGSVTHEETQAP